MNRPEDANNPGHPPAHGRAPHPDDTTRTTLDTPIEQALLPGAGTMVFQRYRLRHVLGRGGMGVVWLAEDTKLERTVALKFLPDVIGGDPMALHELKEETRRGLELAHPHIVRIYDFVDDEEAAAISMEYVNGRSLADMRLAKPHKVFSVDELAPWVREMCDALDYAHTQCQLVHRDLKPANLMINAGAHVKITDFGIARSMTETMTRVSISGAGTSGTTLYMSPQQVMGERPVPTDDIYSLGATLYELLTSKPPFYRGDISVQVASKVPPLVRERRAELNINAPDVVPEHWESAIAACLAKDPASRPQSAAELAMSLGLAPQTAATLPAATPHVADAKPAAPPARPFWRRKRWVFSAAGLTALVLLVLWRANRPAEWAVQTYPAGAFVSLGGVTQVSPAKFQHLRAGRHHAAISLEGYETRRLEFKVRPGQKVNIGVIKLSPAIGNIPLAKGNEDFEITSVTTSVVPQQPDVGEPPNGSWNLDEIFLHSEYSHFSSNGRHFILREAQRLLAERGHYKGDLTGDANSTLHKSIQSFQMLRQLKPTGLLDSATLQGLGLVSQPDRADWTPESENSDKEGWWRRNVSGPLSRLWGD